MNLQVTLVRDLLGDAIRYARTDRVEAADCTRLAADLILRGALPESAATRLRLFLNLEAARSAAIIDTEAFVGACHAVRHELAMGEGSL
jgi:hypothetical protein